MKYRKIIAHLLIALCWSVLALFVLGTTAAFAQGNVNVVLVDVPSDPARVGDTFSVIVQVRADAQEVDLAEVHLDFDPAVLQVNSLTMGTSLPVPLIAARFDNATGQIDYAGATFAGFPSGNFDLLTIEFETIAIGTSPLSFATEFPRQTITTSGGQDVLGSAQGTTVEVSPALAITIGWFYTERSNDDVTVQWQTASETGTAGFRVVAALNDERVQLNAELIPSEAIDSVEPIDYRFTASTDPTVFYLHEVGIDGHMTENGPYDIGVPYGNQVGPNSTDVVPVVWLPLITK